MIQVVSGLLRSGDRVLMGLRGDDGRRPGLWELPGGKVELGESFEYALRREWLEELGVVIDIGDHLASAVFEVEQVIIVHLYSVRLDDSAAKPIAKVHAALQWVRPAHAVERLPCSPGFYLHYPAVARWMR